jgi:hypothetical protein
MAKNSISRLMCRYSSAVRVGAVSTMDLAPESPGRIVATD